MKEKAFKIEGFKGIFLVLVFLVLSVLIIGIWGLKTKAAPTATHFWIGGASGGNWSDPTKWSLTSGGAPCNCVPGPTSIVGFNGTGNGNVTLDTNISVDTLVFLSGYSSTFNAATFNVTLASDLWIESNVNFKFGLGTWNIGDDAVFTTIGGAPTVSLGGATINLNGDWNNSGVTIIPGTSTLSLTGVGLNQNIFGNSSFYNFSVTPQSTKFIGFQENTTTTITGALTLQGLNPDNKVHIQTVNAGGLPIKVNSTISPSGSVSLSNITVQFNTNAGTPNPLTSLSDEVVEMVPFSTAGWFPTRGPGGETLKVETWSLANSVLLDSSLEVANGGDSIRRWNSVLGGTIITQDDVSKQPTLLSNAFNFNPTLVFDGVDDVLSSVDGWASQSYYIVAQTADDITADLQSNPSFFSLVSWESPNTAFPVGGFALGGNFTSTLALEVLTHAIGSAGGNGEMYRAAQLAPDANTVMYENEVPYVFASIENAGATLQDLFANGKTVGNTSYQTHMNFMANKFNVGSYILDEGGVRTPCCFFEGKIPEIISYSFQHDATRRQKVMSYLALKYGITLDQTTAQNYVASDGSLVWDGGMQGASVYDNDIAGIGQDNASALYQPKSKSVNPDDIITIGDPDDLENLEFLTWGNNNGATNAWYTSPTVLVSKAYEALLRSWQVQETGDVGAVNVYIPTASLPATPGAVYLLVDTDTNFSNATPLRMIKIGSEWQLETPYNFTDGQIFTVAYAVITTEFQDALISGLESSPATMTNILVKGEVINPISFTVTDITNAWALNPKATAGQDYTFTTQTITVPVGDYRTSIYAIPLVLSITDDLLVENNEYTNFTIGGLPLGVKFADITGNFIPQLTHNYVILNDDSVNVIVDPTSISIAEGESGQYTIVLTSPPRPAFPVVIDIMLGSELEIAEGNGIVVGQVTFNHTNWNIPQTVTIWAVEDDDIEGVHYDTVTHAINTALTMDPDYDLLTNIQSVSVTIFDNDVQDEEESSGGGSTGTQTCVDPDGCDVDIIGCTDPEALNYNPAANTVSDESPCLYVLGETDPPLGGDSSDYILEALSNTGECPYFSGFYKLGSEGAMVARWQAFLNVLLGTNLKVDGKFGPDTDIAVKKYHKDWQDIILRPWGHTTPTGYIYKTTNATGNSMIGCPLGTVFISETGEYFNADTYNSAYNLQEMTNELREALNIQRAELLEGYGNPLDGYTR